MCQEGRGSFPWPEAYPGTRHKEKKLKENLSSPYAFILQLLRYFINYSKYHWNKRGLCLTLVVVRLDD